MNTHPHSSFLLRSFALRCGFILPILSMLYIRSVPVAALAQPFSQPRRVVVVVDGDTLILEGGKREGGEWIRLIGVDTPEMRPRRKQPECGAREATAFTRKLAEGKLVRLEYEGRRFDPYGRTLAYVWLPDGGELNAELLKHGLARVFRRCDCKRLRYFLELQRRARQQRRGLWGACQQ